MFQFLESQPVLRGRLGAGLTWRPTAVVSVVEGYHAVRSVAAIIDKGKLEAPIHQEVAPCSIKASPPIKPWPTCFA